VWARAGVGSDGVADRVGVKCRQWRLCVISRARTPSYSSAAPRDLAGVLPDRNALKAWPQTDFSWLPSHIRQTEAALECDRRTVV